MGYQVELIWDTSKHFSQSINIWKSEKMWKNEKK